MFRFVRVLCLVMAAGLLAVAPAYAKTRHVHEGESIQAALDASSPGDTVIVHRGTYNESLQIDKDRIRLRGKHAVLHQPATPGNSLCNQDDPFTAICVVGNLNPDTGEVFDYVKGVRITGFKIEGFSANGILAGGSEDLRVSHVKLLDDGEYGIFALFSKSPRLTHNLAVGNDEAGFYVGDSPDANALVRHNRSRENGEGVLLRDAVGGRVSHNKLSGNCAGVLVLADAPGPAGRFRIDHNRVTANNKVCAGDEEEGEPGLSGLGIGLLGAFDTRVTHNRVLGNQPGGSSFLSGGIAVAQGFGGTDPTGDVVAHNKAFDNLPNDLFWDGNGTVTFKKNKCATSDPDGLCTGGGGHGKHAARPHGHG